MTLVQPRTTIEIPYGSGDEVLEIPISKLPDASESILILQQQDSKITYWIQLAIENYRQGRYDAFEAILNACLECWTQERVKMSLATYKDGDKDRIKALDLLAIYYVRKGKNNPADKRRDYFARAAQKFTEVDKSEFINISKHGSEYQFHLLGRAYCCLIDGKTDQAEAQFNFVHQQQSENVPALLGKACIEFNKKDASGKRNALNYYKKALQICSTAPADVRLGLAICFNKLNMFEKAEEAFSKALALDPKCIGALVGLAVIELNKKTNASIKRGIDYLSRAFKVDKTDPMVLTLLADHFFYSNQNEKVIKLAERALESAENDAMTAQACYQLGRAYHKQKIYEKAFEYYYKATTTFGGSQFHLAHYGLGQMYIHRQEFDSAITVFELVLKANPDNIETLKVLASLYARPNPKESESKRAAIQEKARNYLKKVTETRPDDVEAWVELASLSEQHDTLTALSAYRTSIKLHESESMPVPPELYNNIAALLFSTNSLDESENYYNLALKRCQEEMTNNENHYGCIQYTIQYNLGRLYEAKHQLIEAERTYKNILIQHPMYIDCYLRLGCMERDKGLLFDASDKFKETFRIEPENVDAWTLIGNLHLSKLELTPCQKKFERILERPKTTKPDCYSLISIGNVWLQSQNQPIRDKEKLNVQRLRALTFYKYALQHDPKNIYAASGIGCILAVNGLFNEARDVFSQVREATADFPDVWINLAHIYVEQRQYAAAVQMYENCLRKFFNNTNTDLLSYIARALFKANKLIECKRVLLKARYIAPHDLVILFNLAKVLKTLARQVFEDRKSTFQSVVNAEYELRLAQSYLTYYLEIREKAKTEHERNAVEIVFIQSEAQDCKDLLVQVEKNYKVDAERRDQEESLRKEEHKKQMIEELARKAEEEERRINEEKLKREELENKRRELLKKQEEAKQKMLQEDSGALILDDGSGEEGGESRAKRRKKAPKEGKRRRDEDKDKDRGGRAERQGESARDSRKYKSRAILSSDSSSSEDEVGNAPILD